jgi:hypothetical protein
MLFDAVAYLGPAVLALGVVAFVANLRASKIGALPPFGTDCAAGAGF